MIICLVYVQIKHFGADDEIEEEYCSKLPEAENANCIRMSIDYAHPSIAASFTYQRLGNQLSAFATLYSVWRQFGIYNYINTDQLTKISKVFDLPSSKSVCINDWPYFVWDLRKFSCISYCKLYAFINLTIFLNLLLIYVISSNFQAVTQQTACRG